LVIKGISVGVGNVKGEYGRGRARSAASFDNQLELEKDVVL
jgi:hypothetical protein